MRAKTINDISENSNIRFQRGNSVKASINVGVEYKIQDWLKELNIDAKKPNIVKYENVLYLYMDVRCKSFFIEYLNKLKEDKSLDSPSYIKFILPPSLFNNMMYFIKSYKDIGKLLVKHFNYTESILNIPGNVVSNYSNRKIQKVHFIERLSDKGVSDHIKRLDFIKYMWNLMTEKELIHKHGISILPFIKKEITLQIF